MGRPLTAADRMPEVGDVLYTGPQYGAVEVREVLTGSLRVIGELGGLRVYEEGYGRVTYLRRADGGAATTED